MKYKYDPIDKSGSHKVVIANKLVEKPGVIKTLKIAGEFISLEIGDEIECPTRLYDPDMVPVNEHEESEDFIEAKSESELKKMKKDQLNDYAALIGLYEINSKMKHADMVTKILEYQNGLD